MFATRATAEDLAELRAALEAFRVATTRGDALGRLSSTTRFYDVMLKGCGNRIIAETLEGLVARITFLLAQSMSLPGRSQGSLSEMERMAEAVATGEARGARTAALTHVKAAAAPAPTTLHKQ